MKEIWRWMQGVMAEFLAIAAVPAVIAAVSIGTTTTGESPTFEDSIVLVDRHDRGDCRICASWATESPVEPANTETGRSLH